MVSSLISLSSKFFFSLIIFTIKIDSADDEGIRINTYIDTSGRNSVDFVLNQQTSFNIVGDALNLFDTTKDKFISLDTNKNNTICWDDRYVLHRGAPYSGNRELFTPLNI